MYCTGFGVEVFPNFFQKALSFLTSVTTGLVKSDFTFFLSFVRTPMYRYTLFYTAASVQCSFYSQATFANNSYIPSL